MRRWVMLLSLGGVVGVMGTAYAVEKPAKVRPVHKVLIAALGRDAARATGIEAGLKTRFIKRGVDAAGVHGLVTSSGSAAAILQQIRDQQYDSVLCMAPRKSITVPHDGSAKFSTLEACVETFVSGKLPTGESLEVYPLSEEKHRAEPAVEVGELRDPIPTNPRAAPFHYAKGVLRLFDVNSGEILWTTTVLVKAPAELSTRIDDQVIIYNVWDAIEKSGILPSKN